MLINFSKNTKNKTNKKRSPNFFLDVFKKKAVKMENIQKCFCVRLSIQTFSLNVVCIKLVSFNFLSYSILKSSKKLWNQKNFHFCFTIFSNFSQFFEVKCSFDTVTKHLRIISRFVQSNVIEGKWYLWCCVSISRSVPFTKYLFIFIFFFSRIVVNKRFVFLFLFISLLIFFREENRRKIISTWGVSKSFFCCHHYYSLGIILSLIPTKLILKSLGRAKQ